MTLNGFCNCCCSAFGGTTELVGPRVNIPEKFGGRSSRQLQGGNHSGTHARRTMHALLSHSLFSFLSGLTTAITGFGCPGLRELLPLLLRQSPLGGGPTPINAALSAALVTAVQASCMQATIQVNIVEVML